MMVGMRSVALAAFCLVAMGAYGQAQASCEGTVRGDRAPLGRLCGFEPTVVERLDHGSRGPAKVAPKSLFGKAGQDRPGVMAERPKGRDGFAGKHDRDGKGDRHGKGKHDRDGKGDRHGKGHDRDGKHDRGGKGKHDRDGKHERGSKSERGGKQDRGDGRPSRGGMNNGPA